MSDETKDMTAEEEVETYTLTDEDGNEYEFELLGTCEDDGKVYYAMAPVDDDGSEEYVILRAEEDDEGVTLTTIEDDEEFDRVSDFFNDELFSEVDYDEEGENA